MTNCPKCIDGTFYDEKHFSYPDFDREWDRIMDTQGLSSNDAYKIASRKYPEVIFKCENCKGTGKVEN